MSYTSQTCQRIRNIRRRLVKIVSYSSQHRGQIDICRKGCIWHTAHIEGRNRRQLLTSKERNNSLTGQLVRDEVGIQRLRL